MHNLQASLNSIGLRKIFPVILGAALLSGFFVATANAVVTSIDLTSPDGGEHWNGTHNITWTAAGDPGDTVSILISDNDFVTSATLVASIAYDAGSFSWDTSTVIDETDYKIKILSPLGVFDTSTDVFRVDNTAPTITSVTTYDTNTDGNVDKATVVFSEPVRDSSFAAANFTIDGQPGTVITTGTVDDATFDVTFAAVIGTEPKLLTYTAGSGTDMALLGNPLATTVDFVAVDAAAPVFLSAETTTTTTLDATFSEPLDDATVDGDGSDFTVSGHTVSAASHAAGIVTLTVDAMAVDETPTVTLVGTIEDAANKVAVGGPHDATDGLAPTVTSVSIASDNANPLYAKVGDTVTVSFTANEALNTPVVTIAGNAAVEAGGPTSWTATYDMQAGDTEGVVTFSITFEDTSGNDGTNSPVSGVTDASSVTFDKTNPSTSITTPTTDSVTTVNNVDAVFSVSDTNAVTCAYTVSVDALAGAIPCVGGNISVFTDGRRLLTLNATDAAGNVGTDDVSFVINLDGTLTVNGAGGADFTTIQAAVDGATTGDQIDIAAGSYGEAVTISGKDLTLVGTGDPTTTSFTLTNTTVSGSSGITAPTVNVNSGALIADGILLASDPGTVNVGVATFTGDFTVNKELDLLCAVGATIDVSSILVTADNVTIDSCKFTGDNGGDAFINLDNDTAHSGISITDNTFDGAITTWHVIRAGGSKDDLTITGNTFAGSTSGNDNALILLGVGGSNIDVSNNIFGSFPSTYSLVAIQHNASGGTRTNGLTINGNSFDYTGYTNAGNGSEAISVRYADDVTVNSNILTGSADDTTYEAGITLASVTSSAGQSVISGNTIDGFSRGIRIQRWSGGDGFADDIEITNNTVTNGVSNDLNYGAASTGAGLFLVGLNITVTDSTITDNENFGIYIPEFAGSGGANEITGLVVGGSDTDFNKIFDNGLGVKDELGDSSDAEYNWWGDMTGPEQTTTNPLGTGNGIDGDFVDYSPWCLNDTCSTFGSSDPLDHYDVDPDAASGPINTPIGLTVTAKDANDIKRVNDTSKALMTVDNGASLGSPFVTLSGGSQTTTVNNTIIGLVNIAATQVGGSATGENTVTFTGDVTAPTLDSHSPIDGATDVSVDTAPFLMFNETMGAPTISSANIQLKKYSDDSAVAATVSLVEGGTKVIVTPDAPLEYDTQYYFAVSTGVEDAAGNALVTALDDTTKAAHEFTTQSPPDTEAPVITNIQASGISQTEATITWDTDEDATSRVEYGTTSSYGALSAVDGSADNTSHSVTLTGLTAGTTYHFRVLSSDADSNDGVSVDGTFDTLAPSPDIIAPPVPSISTGTATVNSDSYTISGTAAADTPSDTTRTISVYNGATLAGTAVIPVGQTGWAIVAALTQDTTNSFTAVSTDAAGNMSVASAGVDIIEDGTVGADLAAPDVPVLDIAPDTIDADVYNVYGTLADDGETRIITLYNNGLSAGSAILLAGETDWSVNALLSQNDTNEFTAKATDLSGNSSAESASVIITEADTVVVDATGPVISNIQATTITETSAVITWDTDESSDSLVEFGLTSEYGSTEPDAAMTSSHSVLISGLTAGTTYHFRVTSADVLTNSSTSDDNTFDTTATADTTDPATPVITTSDATIDADTITISGTAGADLPTDGTRTITIVRNGTTVGTLTLGTGITTWSFIAPLIQDTTNSFTANSTDSSGNTSADSAAVVITEEEGTASLAVTGVDAVDTFADDTDDFADGWSWTFHVTVPTDEMEFAMKFSDFVSGANTIFAASNIRYYTAQSTEADTTGEAVTIAGADTYPGSITLDGDADAGTAGRQIDVTVEMKVPVGSAGGSYSASYGTKSETIAF